MLEILKRRLGLGGDRESGAVEDPKRSILTAVCVFLLIGRSDQDFSPEEMQAIRDILRSDWAIPEEDIDEIMVLAEKDLNRDLDPWEYAQLIKKSFSSEEKIFLSQRMWQVVYADGRLDYFEEELMVRLGRFLDLSQEELIEAKVNAKTGRRGPREP